MDACCKVDPNWLKVIDNLIDQNYRLIAGHFKVQPFDSSLRSLVHPLLYLNNRKNYKKKFGFPAGNLIVQKNLFDQIGLFPDDQISGNDIIWTKMAIDIGTKHIYDPNCIVDYPGHKWDSLKEKVKKYGMGSRYHYHNTPRSKINAFLPLRLSTFMDALDYRGLRNIPLSQKLRLYLLTWQIKWIYYRGL